MSHTVVAAMETPEQTKQKKKNSEDSVGVENVSTVNDTKSSSDDDEGEKQELTEVSEAKEVIEDGSDDSDEQHTREKERQGDQAVDQDGKNISHGTKMNAQSKANKIGKMEVENVITSETVPVSHQELPLNDALRDSGAGVLNFSEVNEDESAQLTSAVKSSETATHSDASKVEAPTKDTQTTSESQSNENNIQESMIVAVVMSFVRPGVDNQVLKFLNFVFVGLFLSLAFWIYSSGGNIHVIMLTLIAVCLFASVQWFLIVLAEAKQELKLQKDAATQAPPKMPTNQPLITQSSAENIETLPAVSDDTSTLPMSTVRKRKSAKAE